MIRPASVAATLVLIASCSANDPPSPVAGGTQVQGARIEDVVAGAVRDRPEPVAVVVLDAKNGALLALGRHRGADPAHVALRPGSTVKPLLASVAARAGVLPAGEQTSCDGRYVPVEGFTCFAQHGALALPGAIATSCNVYFYDVARRLGFARVREGFAELGFGAPTGLVPNEAPGRLPTETWMAQRHVDKSHDDALQTGALAIGIGHGALEVTLVQLAKAYVTLSKRLARREGPVDAEISEGLLQVVRGELGTGKLAAVDGLEVAGKTGTAEGAPFDDAAGPPPKDNGWFVGWAPAAAPEIVVAVLVVGGESGGKTAAPIAGSIFRGWHARR